MPCAALDGIDVWYETAGPDDGPAVVLIAGLGQQCLWWPRHLREPLVDAGLRVITFDNRDVGRSTWLDDLGPADIPAILAALRAGEGPSYPYTLADMSADAIGLLDHLGIERAHVAGPSMGGMLAQRLAISWPDRIVSMTSIMSTTGDHRLPGPAPEATEALLAPAAPGLEGAMAAKLHRRTVYGSRGFDFDDDWDRHVVEASAVVGTNEDGKTRQYAATIADGDRTAELRRLDLPVLVVHGADDTLIRPTGGEATAAAVPGARLRLVDGMGHDLPPGVCEILAADLLTLIKES